MKRVFSIAMHLSEFLKLINKAIDLSEIGMDILVAIRTLGPGWCGDEALAVAFYCAPMPTGPANIHSVRIGV